MTSAPDGPAATQTNSQHEAAQIDRANASGLQPVVFIHGLWLLPNSWDRWTTLFEQAGYIALAPGWPDDPDTVAEANANPEVFAHKTIGQIADHSASVIEGLDKQPIVIGHSFGGLLAQIIAGRGLAAVTVAIDPAPFRGVLPLPISALKSGSPVLGNPANRHRAIPLTLEQFRYGFANAVSEQEAKELYETYAVPGSGTPLFQAAAANLNPWTEAKFGDRQCVVWKAEAQRRRHGDHRDAWSRALVDDRQRLEGPRRPGTEVRAAVPRARRRRGLRAAAQR
jgi:non-heme chloroperoxidase